MSDEPLHLVASTDGLRLLARHGIAAVYWQTQGVAEATFYANVVRAPSRSAAEKMADVHGGVAVEVMFT